ncbi:MAG TPA: serine hydrolase domain-containing protein [Nitrososphaerales archaeon]
MSPPRRRVIERKLRTGSPGKVGMSAAKLRNVRSLVRKWVEDGVAQTIEVLVARRGTIVLHEVSGSLTPEPDSPPTPLNAIFPLASVTKLFTATSLMCLVEDGQVGLNRPVQEYIPEFTGEGKDKVLVRHLLTHTSGLREEEIEKFASEQQGKLSIPPCEPTLHPLAHENYILRYGAPLWKPPGTEMFYADFNFDLVGEMVRRVSGVALDGFAKSRIFRPLGMVDTSYCMVDVPVNRRIPRRRAPQDPKLPPDPLFEATWAARESERVYWGSGGAFSTVMDMARFEQMFLNGGIYGSARVLSPATVAEMTRNQIPGVSATFLDEYFPEAGWGLGWSVHGNKAGLAGSLYSPSSFEHGGAGGIWVWVDPELEIVGAYFSSTVISLTLAESLKHWRDDLFIDAVTASVEEL